MYDFYAVKFYARSAIDSIIEKDGNWHIAVYNTTAEQIADLEAAEGVLSTQMISIDENDVFRITLKNPDEVYEFASRYLSETKNIRITRNCFPISGFHKARVLRA